MSGSPGLSHLPRQKSVIPQETRLKSEPERTILNTCRRLHVVQRCNTRRTKKMQILDSYSQNSIISVPWTLGPRDEDLDLEVHGCGCGCSCGCGCGCGCSCSCSCSCDDTGANDDDLGMEDDSGATTGDDEDDDSGPSLGDIGQCASDTVTEGLSDGLAAAIGVSSTGGSPAQIATAFVTAAIGGAAQALTQSQACTQVARDAGASIADGYQELVNDESFKKASETLLVVH